MRRATNVDHNHNRCKHCGQAKEDHRLAVNAAGIVTAGTGQEGGTSCVDAAIEGTLRDLVVQITRLEYDAAVLHAQATVQAERIRELEAENAAWREVLAGFPVPEAAVSIGAATASAAWH